MMTETSCPAQFAVDLFGGKWKTTILYQITISKEPLRFNALRRKIPRITQKMLTQQLRQLERDGLVTRTYFAEVPARVEYAIAPLGQTLVPLFTQLCAWTDVHANTVGQHRAAYDSAS
jgi:DNA-binding HxlR family transcriptional regulator